MRIILLIATAFLPAFLFAQTAPANGTTTFNSSFSATGNLLGITASPGTAANAGSPSLYPAIGLLATGWDFTAASSGNVSIGVVAGGATTGTATDYCVRLNALSGTTFQYGAVKSNNSQTFSLTSVYVKFNITAGAPASFTITGYKSNLPVSGATKTINSIPNSTWILFDVSTTPAFGNVDQFRFSASGTNTATVTYIVIDQITIAPATPLPLTLTDFSGKRDNANVNLQWTTASEQNTSYFDIQRSTTGTDYQSIGKVAAAGNSNTTLNYQYTDTPPATSSSWFYRLVMTDLDGRFTYSPILHIGDAPSRLSLSIYPNPIIASANILIGSPSAAKAQLLVRDASGKTLLTESLTLQQGNTLYPLPETARLPKGVYWLTLVTTKGQQSISFIKGD